MSDTTSRPEPAPFSWLSGLKQLEVYLYHDGPLLYAAQRPSGELYLVLLIDADDETAIETWLYARISRDKLLLVRSGGLSVREGILSGDDDSVLRVQRRGQEIIEVTPQLRTLVSDEDLPAPSARLKMQSPSQLLTMPMEKIAEDQRRDVVCLAVELGYMPGVAPVAVSAPLMQRFQTLIHYFATKMNSTFVEAERMKVRYVKRDTDLEFFAVSPGSFGMYFMGSQFGDLFGQSLIGKSLGRLISIVGAVDDEAFADAIAGFEGKAARELRDFLESVRPRAEQLRLDWVAAGGASGDRFRLTKPEIQRVIERLERGHVVKRERLVLDAQVTGANVRLKTFEVSVVSGKLAGATMKGRLSDDAVGLVPKVRIGALKRYEIRVDVEVVSMPLLRENKRVYTLLDIQPSRSRRK